uniref:WIYLD domain-containing protein n=1 Tax=Oryza punctata TaxID=4537 RepID=A0A0E0LYA3_ORYPU
MALQLIAPMSSGGGVLGYPFWAVGFGGGRNKTSVLGAVFLFLRRSPEPIILAMPRQRAKKGARRIDAAIDHFTPMGYATADIRTVIKKLLQVYGGNDGWPFLEEDSYRVVQEALFDKQEQEEQQQQLEEAPLVDKSLSIIEVNNVMPAETEQQVEDADPMLVGLPAVEATLPLPEATVTYGTRRPCYGWIEEYESETDNEEQPASLICKRKRPSRWDIKPINW